MNWKFILLSYLLVLPTAFQVLGLFPNYVTLFLLVIYLITPILILRKKNFSYEINTRKLVLVCYFVIFLLVVFYTVAFFEGQNDYRIIAVSDNKQKVNEIEDFLS